jgi:hypothetical protein
MYACAVVNPDIVTEYGVVVCVPATLMTISISPVGATFFMAIAHMYVIVHPVMMLGVPAATVSEAVPGVTVIDGHGGPDLTGFANTMLVRSVAPLSAT